MFRHDHRTLAAKAGGDLRAVYRLRMFRGGGAQFGGIPSQQDGAAGTRHDVSNEAQNLFLERAAVVAALRQRKGAEQEEQRAGAQKRVVLRIGRHFHRVFAIDQHGFTDTDLVAGLQAVIGDPHSIDVRPNARAPVRDVVPAFAKAQKAVLPSDIRFGQPDLGRLGAANTQFAGPEREPRAQKFAADDDEFRFHKECFSAPSVSGAKRPC